MVKGQILFNDGNPRYFDKDGNELQEGDRISYPDGRVRKVYRTKDRWLGTDATNPEWIKLGKAVECEYGVYPFDPEEMEKVVKVQ